MPIYVAKNADFSANKIETIELGYSELTENTLTAFNNSSLTNVQKSALNTFLNALQSNGILAKQKMLFIPVLADALGKALINVSDNYNVEANPSASAFALNNGIYNNVTGTALNVSITLADNLRNDNFHFLSYNTTTTGSINDFPSVKAPTTADLYINAAGGSTSIAGDALPISQASGSLLLDQTETSLKGISAISLDSLIIARADGDLVDSPYTSSLASSKTIPNTAANLAGFNSSRMLASQAIISIGDGLTLSEVQTFQTLCNNFLSDF